MGSLVREFWEAKTGAEEAKLRLFVVDGRKVEDELNLDSFIDKVSDKGDGSDGGGPGGWCLPGQREGCHSRTGGGWAGPGHHTITGTWSDWGLNGKHSAIAPQDSIFGFDFFIVPAGFDFGFDFLAIHSGDWWQ
jgi:hypothetical protein